MPSSDIKITTTATGSYDGRVMFVSRAPFPFTYPDLPITERREELLDVIEANQVVVVAGETGSGKSTQLPKFCLELGRGQNGVRIGHTQPRRIAARSIAERLASELGTDLGAAVGYAVRFTDEVGPDTLVKVMTDGILLNEIQRDRDLRAYDTIIVDEAHERSLNIDFLLGHLKNLVARRHDLKVIITSATIDTERFSQHFGNAPIVEVSGRTYPVEIRYRPLDAAMWGDSGDDYPNAEVLDQPAAVCAAVTELWREGSGDILAFFAGERDIRDAEEALLELDLPNAEVVPLYARLSAAEQHRVFAAHTTRRIVLSTNVAETSLTVPGIRYVIDTGTARISRFNRRTKVQRLPIEPISQASANQRSGRCGRVAPGIAIRLYSEQDFASRDEFTEPEIQRTNLAAVILRMKAARLGDIERFGFVDAPDSRSIADGMALLRELGALDNDDRITDLGRRIDRLPVDPRIARMVLAGAEMHCLDEVLIIAAGLSVRDPRERPKGQEQPAAEMHKRFRVGGSDLLGWLELWRYIGDERSAGSSSRFRRLCRKEFLNYPRIREWQEVHGQLKRACRDLGVTGTTQPGRPDDIHRAILSGLLSQIGKFDKASKEYLGTRGTRFALSPASSLFKTGPLWVVAADLVETTRTWAHSAAAVERDWIVDVGHHLIRYSYGEPWWDAERGSASVLERAVMLGMVLYDDRPAQLSRIDPAAAREMFIRHALVEGDWHARHSFVERNHERIREVLDLESRNRRTDLLVGDDDLVDWFDRRLPDHITSVSHFDAWWRRRRKKDKFFLDLRLDDLIEADDVGADDFPSIWPLGDVGLHINYAFEPGSVADGATVDVPPYLVSRLDPAAFEWHVPGRRREIVDVLVRKLPKTTRRALGPAPETVDAVLAAIDPANGGGLIDAVRAVLVQRSGVPIARDELRTDLLADHLRIKFRLTDGSDNMLVTHDIAELKAAVADQHRDQVRRSTHPVETTGATDWTFGTIPRTVTLGSGPQATTAYPALTDEGTSVGVVLYATAAEQAVAMWQGLRRLLRLTTKSPARAVRHLMNDDLKRGLAAGPYVDTPAWFADCLWCAYDHLIEQARVQQQGLPWDLASWELLVAATNDQLVDVLETVIASSTRQLLSTRSIKMAAADLAGSRLADTMADVHDHLSRLVYDGVLGNVGTRRLADVERYLRGIEVRLERAERNVQRDQAGIVSCRRLESEWALAVRDLGMRPELEDLGWLLQEFRVATFAQTVGAKGPVSEKRIRTELSRIRADRG